MQSNPVGHWPRSDDDYGGVEYLFESCNVRRKIEQYCFTIKSSGNLHLKEIVTGSFYDDVTFERTFDYCLNDHTHSVSKIITDILYTTNVLVLSEIVTLVQEKRNEQ